MTGCEVFQARRPKTTMERSAHVSSRMFAHEARENSPYGTKDRSFHEASHSSPHTINRSSTYGRSHDSSQHGIGQSLSHVARDMSPYGVIVRPAPHHGDVTISGLSRTAAVSVEVRSERSREGLVKLVDCEIERKQTLRMSQKSGGWRGVEDIHVGGRRTWCSSILVDDYHDRWKKSLPARPYSGVDAWVEVYSGTGAKGGGGGGGGGGAAAGEGRGRGVGEAAEILKFTEKELAATGRGGKIAVALTGEEKGDGGEGLRGEGTTRGAAGEGVEAMEMGWKINDGERGTRVVVACPDRRLSSGARVPHSRTEHLRTSGSGMDPAGKNTEGRYFAERPNGFHTSLPQIRVTPSSPSGQRQGIELFQIPNNTGYNNDNNHNNDNKINDKSNSKNNNRSNVNENGLFSDNAYSCHHGVNSVATGNAKEKLFTDLGIKGVTRHYVIGDRDQKQFIGSDDNIHTSKTTDRLKKIHSTNTTDRFVNGGAITTDRRDGKIESKISTTTANDSITHRGTVVHVNVCVEFNENRLPPRREEGEEQVNEERDDEDKEKGSEEKGKRREEAPRRMQSAFRNYSPEVGLLRGNITNSLPAKMTFGRSNLNVVTKDINTQETSRTNRKQGRIVTGPTRVKRLPNPTELGLLSQETHRRITDWLEQSLQHLLSFDTSTSRKPAQTSCMTPTAQTSVMTPAVQTSVMTPTAQNFVMTPTAQTSVMTLAAPHAAPPTAAYKIIALTTPSTQPNPAPTSANLNANNTLKPNPNPSQDPNHKPIHNANLNIIPDAPLVRRSSSDVIITGELRFTPSSVLHSVDTSPRPLLLLASPNRAEIVSHPPVGPASSGLSPSSPSQSFSVSHNQKSARFAAPSAGFPSSASRSPRHVSSSDHRLALIPKDDFSDHNTTRSVQQDGNAAETVQLAAIRRRRPVTEARLSSVMITSNRHTFCDQNNKNIDISASATTNRFDNDNLSSNNHYNGHSNSRKQDDNATNNNNNNCRMQNSNYNAISASNVSNKNNNVNVNTGISNRPTNDITLLTNHCDEESILPAINSHRLSSTTERLSNHKLQVPHRTQRIGSQTSGTPTLTASVGGYSRQSNIIQPAIRSRTTLNNNHSHLVSSVSTARELTNSNELVTRTRHNDHRRAPDSSSEWSSEELPVLDFAPRSPSPEFTPSFRNPSFMRGTNQRCVTVIGSSLNSTNHNSVGSLQVVRVDQSGGKVYHAGPFVSVVHIDPSEGARDRGRKLPDVVGQPRKNQISAGPVRGHMNERVTESLPFHGVCISDAVRTVENSAVHQTRRLLPVVKNIDESFSVQDKVVRPQRTQDVRVVPRTRTEMGEATTATKTTTAKTLLATTIQDERTAAVAKEVASGGNVAAAEKTEKKLAEAATAAAARGGGAAAGGGGTAARRVSLGFDAGDVRSGQATDEMQKGRNDMGHGKWHNARNSYTTDARVESSVMIATNSGPAQNVWKIPATRGNAEKRTLLSLPTSSTKGKAPQTPLRTFWPIEKHAIEVQQIQRRLDQCQKAERSFGGLQATDDHRLTGFRPIGKRVSNDGCSENETIEYITAERLSPEGLASPTEDLPRGKSSKGSPSSKKHSFFIQSLENPRQHGKFTAEFGELQGNDEGRDVGKIELLKIRKHQQNGNLAVEREELFGGNADGKINVFDVGKRCDADIDKDGFNDSSTVGGEISRYSTKVERKMLDNLKSPISDELSTSPTTSSSSLASSSSTSSSSYEDIANCDNLITDRC